MLLFPREEVRGCCCFPASFSEGEDRVVFADLVWRKDAYRALAEAVVFLVFEGYSRLMGAAFWGSRLIGIQSVPRPALD